MIPRMPGGAVVCSITPAVPPRPAPEQTGHVVAEPSSDLYTAALHRVRAVLAETVPDATERTTRSQVAFRRRRGFAYLWRPGQYLRHPAAEVVLSLAFREELPSPRFKGVVHPAPTTWMHHLELHAVADLDDEVAGWLRRAAEEAG